MSISDTALRAAILKTLLDDVTEHLNEDKDDLRTAMRDGGIERVSARLADGTKVASMPLARAAAAIVCRPSHSMAEASSTSARSG